jgi:hypothetical protein
MFPRTTLRLYKSIWFRVPYILLILIVCMQSTNTTNSNIKLKKNKNKKINYLQKELLALLSKIYCISSNIIVKKRRNKSGNRNTFQYTQYDIGVTYDHSSYTFFSYLFCS